MVQTSHDQRQIERSIHTSLTEFARSGHWESVAGADFDGVTAVMKAFLDSSYKEFGLRPDQLEADQLGEILLAKLPKRVPAKLRDTDQPVRIVKNYFEYLRQNPPAALKEFKIKRPISTTFTQAAKQFAGIATGEKAPKLERAEPLQREEDKVGRNDPCPCGSGKKYKKCCQNTANA